jgi:hypothetical protein
MSRPPRIRSASPSVGALLPLALVGLAAAPSAAHGEARSPDRLATTLGYTSLVRAEGEPVQVHAGRFDVWLRGDHATVRARLTTAVRDPRASGYAITAGLGVPSTGDHWGDVASGWPGAPQPGRFSALVVQGRELSRSGQAPAPGDPSHLPGSAQANPVELPPFGFEPEPRGWVHRWRAGFDQRPLEVAWTVAYAGDTYHGGGALDCSCGEPFNFDVANTYVVIDPSRLGFQGTAKLELVVHNPLPFAVEAVSLDGQRTLASLAPGGAWRTQLDPAAGGEPFVVAFLDGWRPGMPALRQEAENVRTHWPSRLEASCTSPTVSDGENMPEEDPRRRWDLECAATIGGKRTNEAVTVPGFLRPAGRPWNAAAIWRRLLALDAPPAERWPALEPVPDARDPAVPSPPSAVRVAPKRYRVSASATVPGGRNGVENLSDGNPDTAWCAPAPGHGRKLTIAFPEPIPGAQIGLLPGYVRTAGLYEANAVPVAVRVACDPPEAGGALADGAPVPLPLVGVPDLYREGVLLPLVGHCPGRRATIEIVELAHGRFSGDVCISELLVVAPATIR